MTKKGDSIYTEEWAIAFCTEIATGVSLREICRRPNSPCAESVFKWLYQHPEFAVMYATAKSAAMDAMGEELLEIADDGTNDWMKANNGQVVLNKEAVSRSRLRCDTRQWLMTKLAPKKFGLKMPDQPEPLKIVIDKKDENA